MQGLLLLDKPEGITSYGAVSAVKRAAGEKRVGHTGTLDPMATGVLPVLIGRATALSGLMTDADKRYKAKIRLGITTSTDDITGEVQRCRDVNIKSEELLTALNRFTGKIMQVPPAYSALKKDGVRMYKLAREGKKTDMPARQVEIFSIELLSDLDGNNEFEINAHVSKGTYIRSLARDIGEFLGTGATLSGLRRTYASGFDISQCITLEKIESSAVSDYVISEENAVLHLRQINVTGRQAERFCHGGQLGFDRISASDISENELFRIKYGRELIGIGFADCERRQIGIKCILNYV